MLFIYLLKPYKLRSCHVNTNFFITWINEKENDLLSNYKIVTLINNNFIYCLVYMAITI